MLSGGSLELCLGLSLFAAPRADVVATLFTSLLLRTLKGCPATQRVEGDLLMMTMASVDE